MSPNLRLSDTNAASDSKGRTWGLEGNLVWWLIGGVAGSILLFFLLIVGLNARVMTSLGVAVVPVLLCLAYIFGLRHGNVQRPIRCNSATRRIRRPIIGGRTSSRIPTTIPNAKPSQF